MSNGTCRECGKATPLGKRGRPLTYCSKYCSNRRHMVAYRKRRGPRVNRHGEYFDRTCVTCAQDFRSSRPTGKFCSDACKGEHYSLTKRTKSKLPPDHPVMLLIAEARKPKPKPERIDRRTARECPGCACWFSPLQHSAATQMVTCSERCARRMSRRRRRARDAGAYGSWTWSEFMRIAKRFDYCCAYCGTKPSFELLDPDHVVPISRGGFDAPTNLLPACRRCNGDKRDLLLDEWAADRETRGKPAVVTNWPAEDVRFRHLTQALLAVAA